MSKYFIIATLGFFNLKYNSQMEKNFCNALLTNDRSTIQLIMNNFLKNLDYEADQGQNFEQIRHWLSGQECIDSVSSPSFLIDTEPPVKEFILKVKGSTESFTIGISLHKGQWKFNMK